MHDLPLASISPGLVTHMRDARIQWGLYAASDQAVKATADAMIPPKEHDMVPVTGDMVRVTGGADVGVKGELVCIDGTDAILKDLKDPNGGFKIVDLVCLAKIVDDN